MNRQMNFPRPITGSILISFNENKNPEVFFNGETDRETVNLHRWFDKNFPTLIPPNPPPISNSKEKQTNDD